MKRYLSKGNPKGFFSIHSLLAELVLHPLPRVKEVWVRDAFNVLVMSEGSGGERGEPHKGGHKEGSQGVVLPCDLPST